MVSYSHCFAGQYNYVKFSILLMTLDRDRGLSRTPYKQPRGTVSRNRILRDNPRTILKTRPDTVS